MRTIIGAALGVIVVLMLASPAADAASGTGPVLEGRGCCSHHHGVCGCVGGRAQCCDGAMSPTCGC
jgi:hypothetical protein